MSIENTLRRFGRMMWSSRPINVLVITLLLGLSSSPASAGFLNGADGFISGAGLLDLGSLTDIVVKGGCAIHQNATNAQFERDKRYIARDRKHGYEKQLVFDYYLLGIHEGKPQGRSLFDFCDSAVDSAGMLNNNLVSKLLFDNGFTMAALHGSALKKKYSKAIYLIGSHGLGLLGMYAEHTPGADLVTHDVAADSAYPLTSTLFQRLGAAEILRKPSLEHSPSLSPLQASYLRHRLALIRLSATKEQKSKVDSWMKNIQSSQTRAQIFKTLESERYPYGHLQPDTSGKLVFAYKNGHIYKEHLVQDDYDRFRVPISLEKTSDTSSQNFAYENALSRAVSNHATVKLNGKNIAILKRMGAGDGDFFDPEGAGQASKIAEYLKAVSNGRLATGGMGTNSWKLTAMPNHTDTRLISSMNR